ncbi:uncharacterized protein LOC125497854 [Beta vulgaris subsp. vulgaris]|uniref:uncharacterized protein LOC125497854 n=1 Tax=Beta vulgaris subsp. vulgaris TaxID=3555 RepID=UPI0020371662|nr:uncharacterized protein LOC125497854 [Beta vulgaris subsp. vulgaris]
MSPRCVIKVDIKKAYDSVEWVFLKSMLKELGFPERFTHWIMAYVKSVSYSILLNGIPAKPFDAMNGLRADHSSLEKIMEAFHKFSRAYGLEASNEKSCIYFSGIHQDVATQLAEGIHMPIGLLPFKYLGVPLAAKKLSFSQCKPLIDKITSRAQGWMTHLLSYVGRLQLVETILGSMQNYWGQIFPLPKKLIKAVENIYRKFLWIGGLKAKKAPVAWSFIQQPKTTGGLNIINMVLWNKAALLKQLWALSFKQDKLWVCWVHAYYVKRGAIDIADG